MEFMMLIVLVAALFVPLLYAIATLLGMRRKFVYPLLRFRRRDGVLQAAKVAQ